MAEQIIDWADPNFVTHVLAKLPAPKAPDRLDPETGNVIVGEKMWEQGVRLQGNQLAVVMSTVRFIQAAGGIRAGKSFVAAVRLFIDFMWRVYVRGVTDDLWGVIGDSYNMATEEMRHLDRLLQWAGIPHDMRTPENSSWHIIGQGRRW